MTARTSAGTLQSGMAGMEKIKSAPLTPEQKADKGLRQTPTNPRLHEKKTVSDWVVDIIIWLILGIVEAFVSGFVSSTFRDAAAFAILILVLLFKPAGLFGKNTREKV